MTDLDPNYVWSRFRTNWLRTLENSVDEMIRIARAMPEYKPDKAIAILRLTDPKLGTRIDTDTSYALKWVKEAESEKEGVPEEKP